MTSKSSPFDLDFSKKYQNLLYREWGGNVLNRTLVQKLQLGTVVIKF